MRAEHVMILSALVIALASVVVLESDGLTGRFVSGESASSVTCSIQKIPYEEYDTVTYQESSKETVSEEVELSYDVKDGFGSQGGEFFGAVNLTNTDVSAGDFLILMTFSNGVDNPQSFSTQVNLLSGMSSYYSKQVSLKGSVNFSFLITPSTKIVTSERIITNPVERLVAVQKYRDEEVCE